MAGLAPRAVSIAEFRAVVAVAFVAHAIVLFVLPHLAFLFAADAVRLMQYGGHGAKINPGHPIVYAIYLIPLVAFAGLFFLQVWARNLLLVFFVITVASSFFLGMQISGPPETFFGMVAGLADGAVLGLAFLSPPQTRQPSNRLMQPTGQERPAADEER